MAYKKKNTEFLYGVYDENDIFLDVGTSIELAEKYDLSISKIIDKARYYRLNPEKTYDKIRFVALGRFNKEEYEG